MTNSLPQTSGNRQITGKQPYWMRLTALWLIFSILLTALSTAWADTGSVVAPTSPKNDVSIPLPNPIKGPIDIVFTAAEAANGVIGRKVCPPLEEVGCKASPTTPEEARKARDIYAAQQHPPCVFLQDTCKKTPENITPTNGNLFMKAWEGIKNYVVEGYDFAKGIVVGLYDQLKDIWDLVSNPLEVLEGLKQLVIALVNDYDNTIASLKKLMSKAAQDTLTQATQCGAYDQGYLIGSYVSPFAALKVLSKVGKLGKYTDKLTKVVTEVLKDIKIIGGAIDLSKLPKISPTKQKIPLDDIEKNGIPLAINKPTLTLHDDLAKIELEIESNKLTSSELGKLNSQSGKIREEIARSYFDPKDYTALDGGCGPGGVNCFDGVFINKKTKELIIVEVKPLKSDGIKLSNGTKTLPDQMSDAWIQHAFNRLPEGPAKVALRDRLANNKFNVQKAVIGVRADDVKLVMLN